MRPGVVDSLLLDTWSRQDSLLQRRDSRAKIAAAFLLLLLIGLIPLPSLASLGRFALCWLGFLVGAVALGGLPLGRILLRAAVVLPFAAVFVLVLAVQGQPERALTLTVRSYASSSVAVLLAASTPIDGLLAGLAWYRLPPLMIEVVAVLLQYLKVLVDQAGRMRTAAMLRGASLSRQSAAGALAVLFARSYERAERLYVAMLLRGYTGQFRRTRLARFRLQDAAVVLATAVLLPAVYWIVQ